MQAVNVLIHGSNRNLVSLEKTALNAFEFKKIDWAQTFRELREGVTFGARDIVIINEDPSLDLAKIANLLRSDPAIANPFAIVIVVTPAPSHKFISKALRLGFDGVVGLPFSAADLWKQLAFFVNNQRTFLRTQSYFGPDRRRLKGIQYGGEERRAGEEFDNDHKTPNQERLKSA